MRRRSFLLGAGGCLVALIGAGAVGYSQVPVIPKRPNPDPASALGWIRFEEGRYTFTLPRAEMGQNIATALKQVACSELEVSWDAVDLSLHDTSLPGVKPTVGSESVQLFAEPLAQACAALRDAVAAGQTTGTIDVNPRPLTDLRVFQAEAFQGPSPTIEQGQEIVTGASLYAADVSRPGMLYGRVLRAPAPTEVASSPTRWDVAAARAISGFVAVAEECGAPIGQAHGLGIVADRPGALDQIADALSVDWAIDGVHPRADVIAAVDVDTTLSDGPLPHSVIDGTPAEGSWDVDLRIDIPLAAHAPIEPRAALAEWDNDRLTVWVGSQDVFYIRDVLTDAYGANASHVHVQSCRVGGGFGGKTICTVEAEAAALARAVGKPVHVQWTRAQEFALAFHRPPSSHRIRARLSGGRITDWDHAQVSSHIMFTSAVLPEWMQAGTDRFAGDGGVARGMDAPYALGNARAAYAPLRLPVHTGPWRGLGAGPNALATESAIDELALAAGADPLAFRLDHVTDARLAACLTRVRDMSKWGAAPAAGGPGVRVGRGVACGIYKGVSYAAAVADVAVNEAGRARVTQIWCVHECGLVINPDQVRAQCEGNLVWSIGMILSDNLPLETGRVTAETFGDAPIPTLTETPPMTIDLLTSDLPPAGAGETGIVVGPGAISNAIRMATGQRLTRFPLDPGQLAT